MRQRTETSIVAGLLRTTDLPHQRPWLKSQDSRENRNSGFILLDDPERDGRDELAFQLQGVFCLQKFNDFHQIGPYLFNGFALGMCAWDTRDTAYEQVRFEIAFDNSVEVHARQGTPK